MHLKEYLNKLNKIGPKDVMKVAKKYFKLDKLSASYMGSQPQAELKSKLNTIPKMWKEIFEAKESAKKVVNKKIKIPKLVLTAKKSSSFFVPTPP